MNGFALTARDIDRLDGVHTSLVAIVRRAAENAQRRFMVIEGVRSPKRQRELYDAGKSRTMNSLHLTGDAVDLAPLLDNGKVPWNRWDYFGEMAETMKAAARILQLKIEWGGDWTTFRDGPHFQLPRT